MDEQDLTWEQRIALMRALRRQMSAEERADITLQLGNTLRLAESLSFAARTLEAKEKSQAWYDAEPEPNVGFTSNDPVASLVHPPVKPQPFNWDSAAQALPQLPSDQFMPENVPWNPQTFTPMGPDSLMATEAPMPQALPPQMGEYEPTIEEQSQMAYDSLQSLNAPQQVPQVPQQMDPRSQAIEALLRGGYPAAMPRVWEPPQQPAVELPPEPEQPEQPLPTHRLMMGGEPLGMPVPQPEPEPAVQLPPEPEPLLPQSPSGYAEPEPLIKTPEYEAKKQREAVADQMLLQAMDVASRNPEQQKEFQSAVRQRQYQKYDVDNDRDLVNAMAIERVGDFWENREVGEWGDEVGTRRRDVFMSSMEETLVMDIVDWGVEQMMLHSADLIPGGMDKRDVETALAMKDAFDEIRNSEDWYEGKEYGEKALRYEVGGWALGVMADIGLMRGILKPFEFAGRVARMSPKIRMGLNRMAQGRGAGLGSQFLIGALEGLPSDISIALKNDNLGLFDVVMGVAIGGLTGMVPVIGAKPIASDAIQFLSEELGEAAAKGSQEATKAIQELGMLFDHIPGVHQALDSLEEVAPSFSQLRETVGHENLRGLEEILMPAVKAIAEDPASGIKGPLKGLRTSKERLAKIQTQARTVMEEVKNARINEDFWYRVNRDAGEEAMRDVFSEISQGRFPERLTFSEEAQEIFMGAVNRRVGEGAVMLTKEEMENIESILRRDAIDQATDALVKAYEGIRPLKAAFTTDVPVVRNGQEVSLRDFTEELGLTVREVTEEFDPQLLSSVANSAGDRALITDVRNLMRQGKMSESQGKGIIRMIVEDFATGKGARSTNMIVNRMTDLRKSVQFKHLTDQIDMLAFRHLERDSEVVKNLMKQADLQVRRAEAWGVPEEQLHMVAEGTEQWNEIISKLDLSTKEQFLETIWPKIHRSRAEMLGRAIDPPIRDEFESTSNIVEWVSNNAKEVKEILARKGLTDEHALGRLANLLNEADMWSARTRSSRMQQAVQRKFRRSLERFKKLTNAEQRQAAQEWGKLYRIEGSEKELIGRYQQWMEELINSPESAPADEALHAIEVVRALESKDWAVMQELIDLGPFGARVPDTHKGARGLREITITHPAKEQSVLDRALGREPELGTVVERGKKIPYAPSPEQEAAKELKAGFREEGATLGQYGYGTRESMGVEEPLAHPSMVQPKDEPRLRDEGVIPPKESEFETGKAGEEINKNPGPDYWRQQRQERLSRSVGEVPDKITPQGETRDWLAERVEAGIADTKKNLNRKMTGYGRSEKIEPYVVAQAAIDSGWNKSIGARAGQRMSLHQLKAALATSVDEGRLTDVQANKVYSMISGHVKRIVRKLDEAETYDQIIAALRSRDPVSKKQKLPGLDEPTALKAMEDWLDKEERDFIPLLVRLGFSDPDMHATLLKRLRETRENSSIYQRYRAMEKVLDQEIRNAATDGKVLSPDVDRLSQEIYSFGDTSFRGPNGEYHVQMKTKSKGKLYDDNKFWTFDPETGESITAGTMAELKAKVDAIIPVRQETLYQRAARQMLRDLRGLFMPLGAPRRGPWIGVHAAVDDLMRGLSGLERTIDEAGNVSIAKADAEEIKVRWDRVLDEVDDVEVHNLPQELLERFDEDEVFRITQLADTKPEDLIQYGMDPDAASSLITQAQILKEMKRGRWGELNDAWEVMQKRLEALKEYVELEETGELRAMSAFDVEGSDIAETLVRQEGTFTDYYAERHGVDDPRYDPNDEGGFDWIDDLREGNEFAGLFLPVTAPALASEKDEGAWMVDLDGDGHMGLTEMLLTGLMAGALAWGVGRSKKQWFKDLADKALGDLRLRTGHRAAYSDEAIEQVSLLADIDKITRNSLFDKTGPKDARLAMDQIIGGTYGGKDTATGKAIAKAERFFTKLTNQENLFSRALAYFIGVPLQTIQKEAQLSRSFYIPAQHHLENVMPGLIAAAKGIENDVQAALDMSVLKELHETGRTKLGNEVLKEIDAALELMKKEKPQAINVARMVNEQYEAILNMSYRAGLIDPQEYFQLKQKGQFYSPLVKQKDDLDFYDLMEIETQSTGSSGLRSWNENPPVLETVEDLHEFIMNPAGRVGWEEMLIADIVGAHSRIGRHQFNRRIVEFADLSIKEAKLGQFDGANKFMTDVTKHTQSDIKALQQLGFVERANEMLEWNRHVDKVLGAAGPSAKIIEIKDVDPGRVAREHFGPKARKRAVLVRSQDFLDMFASMRRGMMDQSGWLNSAMVAFKNAKRMGVTITPDFMLRNFLRDTTTAAIQRESIFKPLSRIARNKGTGADAKRTVIAGTMALAGTGLTEVLDDEGDATWGDIPLWATALAVGMPAAALGDYMMFAAKDVGTGLFHYLPVDTKWGQRMRKAAVKLKFTEAVPHKTKAELDAAERGGRAGVRQVKEVVEAQPDMRVFELSDADQTRYAELTDQIRLERRELYAMRIKNLPSDQGEIRRAHARIDDLLDERAKLIPEYESNRPEDALITLYDELQNSGALSLGFYPLKGSDRAKLIKAFAKKAPEGEQKFLASIKKAANIKDLWDGVGRAIETANRYRIYKTVADEGKFGHYTDATFGAADGTLDFTKKGSDPVVRKAGDWTAFLRPSLLGLEKFWNVGFKEGVSETGGYVGGKSVNWDVMTNTAMAVTAPSVALWYLNHDNEHYKSLPEWEKKAFWHIPISPYGNEWLRIPMPFEVGILGGWLPAAVLDEIANIDDLKRESDQPYMDTMLKITADVGLALFNTTYSYGNVPMPDMLNWATELAVDRNFYTGQSFSNKYGVGPQWSQGGNYDTLLSIKLSQIAYNMPWEPDFAPARIDHMLFSPFAGAGRYAKNILMKTGRELGIDERAEPMTRIKPGTLGMVTGPGTRWHTEQGIMDWYYRGQSSRSAIQKIINEQGNPDKIADILRTEAPYIVAYEGLKLMIRDIETHAQQRDMVMEGTGQYKDWSIEKRRDALFIINQRIYGVYENVPEVLGRIVERVKGEGAENVFLDALNKGHVKLNPSPGN